MLFLSSDYVNRSETQLVRREGSLQFAVRSGFLLAVDFDNQHVPCRNHRFVAPQRGLFDAKFVANQTLDLRSNDVCSGKADAPA